MARILGAFPAALIAARNGLNGSEFIRFLRAAGEGARESEVRALLKTAYNTLKNNPDEPFADPNAVPDFSTASPWPTVSARGVKQAVQLTYRVKATGTLITVPYQVTSQAGVTRAEAIAKAIEAYKIRAEEYGQELVGAIHTKTFQLVPGIVPDTGD
jgi:hypothetical protein